MNQENAYEAYQGVSLVFSAITSIYFCYKLIKVYSTSSCRRTGCHIGCGGRKPIPPIPQEPHANIPAVVDTPINVVCDEAPRRMDSIKSLEDKQDRVIQQIMELKQEVVDALMVIKNISSAA